MPETIRGLTDEKVDILLLGMEEDGYIVVNDNDGSFDVMPEYHQTWVDELKRRAAAFGITLTIMTN